jgi:hypothetical protein
MHVMERRPISSLQNLIFERHPIGVVFLEPLFGGVDIREHLEMIGVADLLCSYSRKRTRSSDDPVALGAIAVRCRRRIRVTVVQRPQHGNAGHHDNAARLGGRDQKFHCDLPTLALGFGRRQCKDINASIA